MTRETLLFLRGLLSHVTLQVSDPEFRTNALSILNAIDELDEQIRRLDAIDPPGPTMHDVDVS